MLTYLRKEKEIVDLRLEISQQDNARLKGRVEHLSHDLNETRKTLSEVGFSDRFKSYLSSHT